MIYYYVVFDKRIQDAYIYSSNTNIMLTLDNDNFPKHLM